MVKANRHRIRWRAWSFPYVSTLYLTLIYGVPTLSELLLMSKADHFRQLATVTAPISWTLAFLLVAGALSLPHQFSIRPGKFRRDINDQLYFHRRLYGLCWTAVYYNKPIYYLCLSIPFVKWMTFRLFGYRGSMNFTIYPDTWIRDLPLLNIEDGAYVANRATLGTNMVLRNGRLLVAPITLRARAMVGHLALLAPGVELRSDAEVGIGSGVGIKTVLHEASLVGSFCWIGHRVQVGHHASVASNSYIGSGSVLSTDVVLPPCTNVQSRHHIVRDVARQVASNV